MAEEKYIDESWKETASEEKEKLEKINHPSSHPAKGQETEDHSRGQGSLEINFINYVTSLAFQAMIFLGEMPNPVTNKVDKNFDQAKFLIDTLGMLREKTKGNLSKQESDILDASIYELQMKYIELTKRG